VEKKVAFFTVWRFWDNFWPLLNIKAVHNLKTKSSSIIFTGWAMFVPISAFLLFLVSELPCGECARFYFFGLFLRFFANFATINKLFPKSKCAHHPRNRRHLCAKI